jgi:regulatory protein
MARLRPTRPRSALDGKRLEELALRYVGRYATTRAKLRSYLARKLRERGWEGEAAPDLDALATRLSQLGYIDDAAYALSKSQALASRGYGRRRLEAKLRIDGVGEEDSEAAREHAEAEAVEAALRFAERRRIGPFGAEIGDSRRREKAIAAMVRAGHSLSLARAIASLPPGASLEDSLLRVLNRRH